VLEQMAAWQSRPRERVYPVVFIDAIVVKIRDGQVANRPVYTVVGVSVEGKRDVLGLWVGDGSEGAKYWHQVLTSRYVDEHRGCLGVEPICRPLSVSASADYQRRSRGRSARKVEDERLLGRIRELHAGNYYAYRYRGCGARSVAAASAALPCTAVDGRGRNQGAKRHGKPWRTTRPDPQSRWWPNLVQRDFSVARPNELWVTDLSYSRSWRGFPSRRS
jgi:hypothetical protein